MDGSAFNGMAGAISSMLAFAYFGAMVALAVAAAAGAALLQLPAALWTHSFAGMPGPCAIAAGLGFLMLPAFHLVRHLKDR